MTRKGFTYAKICAGVMLLACIGLILAACVKKFEPYDFHIEGSVPSADRLAAIHFLGFAWEDGIILESEGRFALIDGGFSGRAEYVADYLKRLAGTDTVELEFVIATHPHSDHVSIYSGISNIGTFTPLFGGDLGITARRAYFREYAGWGPTSGGIYYYRDMVNTFIANDIDMIKCNYFIKNHVITFGNMSIRLLFNGTGIPSGQDVNNESLAQFIQVGDHTVLLTGDLCRSGGNFLRNYLVEFAGSSRIDLLKLGHHGIHGTGVDGIIGCLNPSVAISTNTGAELMTWSGARSNARRIISRQTNARLFAAYDSGGIMVVFLQDEIMYFSIGERNAGRGNGGFEKIQRNLLSWV